MTRTKHTMTATIEHVTKNTYRVQYEVVAEELSGSCLTRGTDIENAKANFPKHYRAKAYQVEWK